MQTKIIMRYYYIPISIAKIEKNKLTIPNDGEDIEQQEFFIGGGMQKDTITLYTNFLQRNFWIVDIFWMIAF